MNFGAQMRAVQDYAGKHGYVGALPTFFEGLANGVIVHGVFLLKQGTAVWRDVTAEELGSPPDNDIGARFRAAQTYATSQGMVGAFPNFYQAPRSVISVRGEHPRSGLASGERRRPGMNLPDQARQLRPKIPKHRVCRCAWSWDW